MDTAQSVIRLLPWLDWAALLLFFAGWGGYVWFSRHLANQRPSLLASTNRIRRDWMLQVTHREVRVVDGVLLQNMSSSPSFFASTTILIIGGLLAVLGSNSASQVVNEIPFAVRTSSLVFDMKVALMLAIFVYAFFRFTWSMRQYTFGALMVASAPEEWQFAEQQLSREAFAERAGRVVGLAAETFNDGLRACYFAFAAMGWFVSPVLFAVATGGVIYVLYQREFNSDVLAVLDS
jgi:uncharacterized membrane protein